MWDSYKRDQSIHIVRFEDLIYDYEKTCSRIFEYLDLDGFKVKEEFKLGEKGEYVGKRIDIKRAKKGNSLFSKGDKDIIISNFKYIFDEFYKDYDLTDL